MIKLKNRYKRYFSLSKFLECIDIKMHNEQNLCEARSRRYLTNYQPVVFLYRKEFFSDTTKPFNEVYKLLYGSSASLKDLDSRIIFVMKLVLGVSNFYLHEINFLKTKGWTFVRSTNFSLQEGLLIWSYNENKK